MSSEQKVEVSGQAETEAKPTAPVFGQASTFGTTGGFGGFSGVSGIDKPKEEDGDDGEEGADQEECGAQFQPVVQLQEVEVVSGEEDEDTWLDYRCKLYRIDNGEWKERGLGQVRLLQHKEDKRVRLLMRQEKTLKIRANHYLMPGIELQSHSGNDKAWVWRAVDYADGEEKVEMFCVRFATAEKATEFKELFEKGQQMNEDNGMGKPQVSAEEKKEADDKADELAKAVADKAKLDDDDPEAKAA